MIDLCDYAPLFDAPILNGLSRDDKRAFFSACTVRTLKSPTPILRQGEVTAGSFLVVSGQVEVDYVDASGNPVIVHTALAGEMLGDVEALSGRPCACSCVAAPDTMVLFCPTQVLHAYIPPRLLIRNLCDALYNRMVRESRNKAADHYYNAEQRLRLHLHTLTDNGTDAIRISQSQLGIVIGCSRQTVNPMLGRLRDQGIIEMGRGVIRVRDRARLADGAPVAD